MEKTERLVLLAPPVVRDIKVLQAMMARRAIRVLRVEKAN